MPTNAVMSPAKMKSCPNCLPEERTEGVRAPADEIRGPAKTDQCAAMLVLELWLNAKRLTRSRIYHSHPWLLMFLLDLAGRFGAAELHWADVLSPGEQQRLSSCLLLNHPHYAFLDEATGALEVANEQSMYELLAKENIRFLSSGHRSTLPQVPSQHSASVCAANLEAGT